MLEKFFFEKILKNLESFHTGSLTIETPDHKKYEFKGNKPGYDANIVITDWQAITKWILKGEIGFADSYCDEQWHTDDLLAVMNATIANQDIIDEHLDGKKTHVILQQIFYYLNRNSLKGSKKNIQDHYDLGNDFYKLWLDPTMTYSSALFEGVNDNLSDAQNNKYDRIINQLNGDSGKLLEIGCGWGGFADRALSHGKDYGIKGITLSEEQHDFANKRLDQQAQIVIEDYRHQTGKFDHIVSIEMFEAVGEKFWPTYFGQMKELLSKNGKAVVQTITIKDSEFEKYKNRPDFIRSYIFPGGMLPSPSRFNEEANKAGLKTSNLFEFRMDYARTLEIWLENFDNALSDVKEMGFDQRFIHLWRLYLSGCAASFESGSTSVQQIELQHA